MEVLEEINRGGFGLVERVRLGDGSAVARKTFDPTVPIASEADRAKLKKRFDREVRYMSSINSGAICPILDYDLDTENPWFTMPFAERTLQQEVSDAKGTGNPPADALADVLNGLEEIHRLGFVHRDLKPANVLLIDGTWRLADFGLILPPSGSTTMLTSVDSAWGTAAYAAPEQSSEFHSVTDAADIYAFGCILHDIYGTPPRIPFARQSAPGLIGAIIERCTDQKPDKRFNSVAALREALSTVLSDASAAAIGLSGTATDWAQSLSDNSIDQQDQFENLIRYVLAEADTAEKNAIYKAAGDEALRHLFELDSGLWKQLIIDYCDWAADTGFDWAFCDTLVQRLLTVFELGETEIKAASILAAARMAVSHNRWYVMRKVNAVCGTELDDDVAARLAIDVRALGAKRDFRSCAERVHGGSVNAYHPTIRDAVGAEI